VDDEVKEVDEETNQDLEDLRERLGGL